jgi:hypothetical protein
MARFLPLIRRAVFYPAAFSVCLAALVFSPVASAAPATSAAPAQPAPLAPGVPPLDDYFARYGKILTPSTQSSYPFKLNMPFPGFGEVKIPTREELDERQILEQQLATLSDAQIRDQLEKWPAFGKMSLVDEGAMFARIQLFRDYRHKRAMEEAHRLGLLTLNPAQQARFEKEYWDKQLQMDRQLAQQLEPIYKTAQQKLNEDLYRQFSSPGRLVQAPKSPAAPPPSGPALAH